jgi:hypothetical protein
MRSRAPLRPVLIAALSLAAACGGEAPAPAAERAPARTTCPPLGFETTLDGFRETDRELVPYSPTVMGVEATFKDEARMIQLISGGYLDDVLEAYDDLHPLPTVDMNGAQATAMTGESLSGTVHVAVWKQPAAFEPCGLRVVLTHGFDDPAFFDLLAAVH